MSSEMSQKKELLALLNLIVSFLQSTAMWRNGIRQDILEEVHRLKSQSAPDAPKDVVIVSVDPRSSRCRPKRTLSLDEIVHWINNDDILVGKWAENYWETRSSRYHKVKLWFHDTDVCLIGRLSTNCSFSQLKLGAVIERRK